MKKCVVKLIWYDSDGKECDAEYVVMDLNLNNHRESSIYNQIRSYLAHEGPTFDGYKWQEINI